jgi:hypothetical protein
LSRIALALLAMTGRVTMLGIARWAGDGGSYRTIQHFFATAIPWAAVLWLFFRQHLFHADDVYLLAGDEVVITKAGKHTFGLDRFFSGVYQRPVPGLAFFSLALVSTHERRAFPIRVEQVVRTVAEKAATKAKTAAKKAKAAGPKRKPGRPKGSKTKPKAAGTWSLELQRIHTLVEDLLRRIAGWLSLTYLVLDGHFGTSAACQLARQCGLHLISKLRCDAALYAPYDGPYAGRGPHRKYGAKLDYRNLPEEYLQQTSVADGVETRIYQAELLHKEFAQPLNVVILEQLNLTTQAGAHVVLFSSDLTLGYGQLITYYSLRFQIEIVFPQVTKADVRTGFGRGNDVTNLHLLLIHDHAINQQFHQLAPLFKCHMLQTDPQALTEHVVVSPVNWPDRNVRILPAGGPHEDRTPYCRADHQDPRPSSEG